MIKDLAKRFWEKVHIRNPNECWEWQGTKKATGYGVFAIDSHHVTPASRMAYTLTKGIIPKGLTIDHLCYNPPCCNPSHLEIVTMAENLRRAAVIGRGPWQFNLHKTHCIHGHPYSEANTYIPPSGHGRYCKICRNNNKHRQRLHQRSKGLNARNKPIQRKVSPLNYTISY